MEHNGILEKGEYFSITYNYGRDRIMETEDNPYYKCLKCHEYVDPAKGHMTYPNGTMHWHCHPQLKYKSDVFLKQQKEKGAVMKIGQHFSSQSKIQDKPTKYVYLGIENGQHCIQAASGITDEDCRVDVEWFDNRKIKLID